MILANIFVAQRVLSAFPVHKVLVISRTFLHLIFPLDVAERAFSKCVKTNEGEEVYREKVLANGRKLKVKFNYEFLEDFQDKQSSDRYTPIP